MTTQLSTSAKTFWIIQTGFLGDCVLTLPFLYRLAERYPEAKIKIICRPSGEELFRLALERGLSTFRLGQAPTFELQVFDKRGRHKGVRGFFAFLKSLGATPTAVFCLQRSARTGLLALLSRAPKRVGFTSGAASFLYNVFAPRDWESGKTEIEKNLDLLRAFERSEGAGGAPITEWHTRLAPSLLSKIPTVAQVRTANPTNNVRRPLNTVALSLGSPWGTKRWNIEHATQLVWALTSDGVEVRLIGDALTADLVKPLRAAVPSLLLKDYCGKTGIGELLDVIGECDALISNDSAPVHLASDLAVPTLAIFGPTIPDFGFAPWRRGSLALGVTDLPCRPCDIHGPMVCPLGHHKCMKELTSDLVLRQMRRLGP